MTIEPSAVAAQSGMATDDIRDRIEDSGATANISPKVNRCTPPSLNADFYKQRNLNISRSGRNLFRILTVKR